MQITYLPVRMDHRPTFERQGDALLINGEVFDFAGVPDGATLPADAVASDFVAGPVERIDGVLHLSLILAHGAVAPMETRAPVAVSVPSNGPIPQPPYNEAEGQ